MSWTPEDALELKALRVAMQDSAAALMDLAMVAHRLVPRDVDVVTGYLPVDEWLTPEAFDVKRAEVAACQHEWSGQFGSPNLHCVRPGCGVVRFVDHDADEDAQEEASA